MRARGFSLLELTVVVAAVGILAGLALERLLPLVGRAQHAAFLHVQRELKSALLLEAAERITRGEAATLAELAGANPMALLLEPPANYAGVLHAPQPGEVRGHTWYYDAAAGRLVYRVGRYTRFEPLAGPADRIELAVQFAFTDRDGDGAFHPGADEFQGLRLGSVHAYRWAE